MIRQVISKKWRLYILVELTSVVQNGGTIRCEFSPEWFLSRLFTVEGVQVGSDTCLGCQIVTWKVTIWWGPSNIWCIGQVLVLYVRCGCMHHDPLVAPVPNGCWGGALPAWRDFEPPEPSVWITDWKARISWLLFVFCSVGARGIYLSRSCAVMVKETYYEVHTQD